MPFIHLYIFIHTHRTSKKEDWNAIVRKNTIARDPIGSTRNSLTRRDRRSLRRRILEVADEGLQMNTQRIVGRWFVRSFDCLFAFDFVLGWICDRVAQLPSIHLLCVRTYVDVDIQSKSSSVSFFVYFYLYLCRK